MLTLQRLFAAVAAVLLLALLPTPGRADGFIVIHNAPPSVGHFRFAPLEVSYHRVEVKIDDQVAVTSIDQEFVNPNSVRMEGTYLFPLPPGSHIDRFQMDINGTMQEAELLPADKARSLYEEIVRKYQDPALLEYVGRDAFKVRIFPIEPNSRKRIKLQYTQLLRTDTGLTEYVYPLNTEKFSARPLKEVSIKVTLAGAQPLRSIYSPSHNVQIKRDGDRRATIGFEEKDIRPDTDFRLIWSKSESEVGISLLSYRTGSDDGYFLLLATPGVESTPGQVQLKDIAFVLDTSGSMAGAKLEQARKALAFCLANLNEGDRFEIVRFSTEAEPLFNELKPASQENLDKARQFVKGLKPIGGTAIDDALAKALKIGADRSDKAERPYMVVFLTDGQPTIGQTQEDPIVASVSRNVANTRIFSFGIGTDVNTHLLDRIAEATKSFSQYVLPDEDIEIKLSNFYTKIKEPVLSNVEFAVTSPDVRISKVYPNSMPDLFRGEMLVAFGRYSGSGPAAVTITGTLNGAKRQFSQDVAFTKDDADKPFIARLWATRRVGWLLDEIRMSGESSELKDEVVALAREHGIVTPYTSYLILEDEARRGVPMPARTLREMEGDARAKGHAGAWYDSSRKDSSRLELAGERAVANSQVVSGLKYGVNEQQARQLAEVLAKSAPAPVSQPGVSVADGAAVNSEGYRFQRSYAQQVRVVDGRAFYQNGNTWTDGTLQTRKDLKPLQIKFNSDEYFALLRKHPLAAAWLALGNEVDVVIGQTLYQIR